jgi:hypothetical protein
MGMAFLWRQLIMASTWKTLFTHHFSFVWNGRAVACIPCMMDSMILYNFGVQNRDTSSPECNCTFMRKSQHWLVPNCEINNACYRFLDF